MHCFTKWEKIKIVCMSHLSKHGSHYSCVLFIPQHPACQLPAIFNLL